MILKSWAFVFISFVSYLSGAEKIPVAVYDLPHHFSGQVDSIIIQVHNAFDGSRVNWNFDFVKEKPIDSNLTRKVLFPIQFAIQLV